MTKVKITEKLQDIFRDVFDNEGIVLFDEMTADDVADWDSLTHINLINDIEAEFGIEFTTDEIVHIKNVGEFIKVIEGKMNK